MARNRLANGQTTEKITLSSFDTGSDKIGAINFPPYGKIIPQSPWTIVKRAIFQILFLVWLYSNIEGIERLCMPFRKSQYGTDSDKFDQNWLDSRSKEDLFILSKTGVNIMSHLTNSIKSDTGLVKLEFRSNLTTNLVRSCFTWF